MPSSQIPCRKFQSRNRETFDSNTFTYTATDAEGITVSIS